MDAGREALPILYGFQDEFLDRVHHEIQHLRAVDALLFAQEEGLKRAREKKQREIGELNTALRVYREMHPVEVS